MIDGKIRLYFIARSVIMGLAAGTIFLSVVWYLGTIDFVTAVMISIGIFVLSLAISRILENRLERIVNKAMRILERHKKLRKFIMEKF